MMKFIRRPQTLGEEVANAVTHGVGVGLSIAGLSILVTLSALYGDLWRVVSFSIYGATMVLLYLASTLYHGIQSPRVKRVLHVFDHAGIFLLIAGTYTPFTLVTLRGPWGWTLFGVIWGLALAGVVMKIISVERFRLLSVALYVLMGWLVAAAFGPLTHSMPPGGVVWIVMGGLAYTVGVAFYLWSRLPFHHMIWHMFVMAGSLCHFFAMLWYVLPVGA